MAHHSEFDIASLGYLQIATSEIDAWRKFAGPCLGMEAVERGRAELAFRMDDRAHRLIVTDTPQAAPYIIGWEAVSRQSMERIAVRLEKAGTRVEQGKKSLTTQRVVAELICFQDPAGNCLEVFCDPVPVERPFSPGRSHSGFRTGALGLGHVVLTAPDLEALIPFYRDLLGFQLSDYQLNPFPAFFFHINQRHHSLALIKQSRAGIHHLMIEHTMFDDVGQGLDVMKSNEHTIGVSLGRHTNDLMTSFYVQSPSPFMVECGWGGREIDPATWEPVELENGPSLWGHDRSWLSPEQFAEADRMRRAAAAKGMRAPVNVLPGNYVVCKQR